MSATVLAFVNSDYADTPYDTWAAKADVQAHLLISGEKHPQYLHVPDARAFADYQASGAVELAAWELAERVRPDVVVARSECDVLRAARLRELFAVPGQDLASALAFRDKVLMKTLARAGGVPVPPFAPAPTALDVLGFARDHGYPVVLKPAFGSGSAGTQVLRDPTDLAAALRAGLPERAMVEAFVPGGMCVVDGLVCGGEVVAAFASRYLNDCLSYHSGAHLGSAQITRDDPLATRLMDFARRVLDALPTPECTTFHLEVFRTRADELVLCEIASRTGGALTTAAVHAATGFDLDQEWFLAQVGQRPAGGPRGAEPGRSAGWVVFYPEHGRLVALPGTPPPYVVEHRSRAEVGATYQGGVKSGHYLSAYVVAGADADEVERNVDDLAAWHAAGIRWER